MVAVEANKRALLGVMVEEPSIFCHPEPSFKLNCQVPTPDVIDDIAMPDNAPVSASETPLPSNELTNCPTLSTSFSVMDVNVFVPAVEYTGASLISVTSSVKSFESREYAPSTPCSELAILVVLSEAIVIVEELLWSHAKKVIVAVVPF